MEKNKQWKNEMLMETLRSKSSKTFQELAKNTRLNLLERRYNIDAVEKQILQSALDNLQNNIQIKNRTHFVERLESITRRALLKFTDNANTNSLFISSDMFYLEISLDPQSGKVNDVKVHHECSNESSSEPTLIDVLRKGDFIDFTQQLEGFQSIYQLNAESKIKSKAFIAIQSLESDLANIYSIESSQNMAPEVMVNASSVGLLFPRVGGHAMKLIFFVRPTELLNIQQKRMDSLANALQTATAAKKSIGNSVTINLEAAAPSNKLQIAPLLIRSGIKVDGNYNFNQININNSTMLPAAFVLRLNQGMPVTTQLVNEIKKITNDLGVFGDESPREAPTTIKLENYANNNVEQQKEATTSLINLIVHDESQGSYENGQKGLFITLADQSHCYYISENPELTGTIIKSIQFAEPSHVIKIIKLLRQQALFNSLIASCVRKRNNCSDYDCYLFEVTVVSLHFIQIFVEHPIKESIVTVELDLSDVKQVSCKINGSNQQFDSKLENYICRVLHKTMSIPMVLRSLMKFWESEAQESQRRLYNNGIYGSLSESKKENEEKKDDIEKGNNGGGGTFDDIYGGSRQDTSGAFDICGINKNEIFFKTTEQKSDKRIRSEAEMNVDFFDPRSASSKMSRVMSFEMDDGSDEMLMSQRSLTVEDLLNENSMSPGAAMLAEATGKKILFPPKSGAQKPLDVFEFNDPSPPPANTVMVPLQSPLADERSRKIPTPRASPSTSASPFNIDKRVLESEMIPMKSQLETSNSGASTISITPISNSNSSYDKKSEKKKKRKREEGESGSSPSVVKKKSSDSLASSPSKKSSSSSQLMGKPSFKPKKSPVPGASIESMDDLSFLNFGGDPQANVPSSLPSPQSLLKNSTASSQANRKNSLSAVINKLKSEMSDALTTPAGEEKKSEYHIKSSGSDGIKITFNKTKSSKGSNSPKHTGLKPGVTTSKPLSKKSSQSSKSSSQKLLFQKSSSSGSLNSGMNSTVPSPKSSSQPGKSSSKDKSKESIVNPFAGFSGSSNDMLKNMLNLASPTPRTDIMKAFDKKFQIPKLSARGKSDEKSTMEDIQSSSHHPRSAPSTPIQSMTPSPTMDFREQPGSSQFQLSQSKFFSNTQQQNKFIDPQRQNKKLFKSVSSEQLYGEPDKIPGNDKMMRNMNESTDSDFQAFLRAQSKMNESSISMHVVKSPRHLSIDGNMMQSGAAGHQTNHQEPTNTIFNEDDLMDLNFIGNEI